MAHISKVPYASAIGSLMYAMVCTRPDISHAVGVVSKKADEQSRKRTLDGSEVDYQVFERYHKSRIMFWWFKHCSIGIC